MCILYAIYLFLDALVKRLNPKIIVTYKPNFHVIIVSAHGMAHGTDKGGKWHIEKLQIKHFIKWSQNTKCKARVIG